MSNYTLWGLFGPATWPWWLATLALLTLLTRSPRWPRRLTGAAVAVFLLFAVLPTGYWLTEPLERRFPQPDLDGRRIAHIVVLAGAEQLAASARSGRGEVGEAAERIIEGAALARARPAAKLWIVGGVRDRRSPRADADWTALTWRRLGLSAQQIRTLDGTLNTCENARGIAARQLEGEVLLVTSAMHMPRAVACFRAAQVAATPYPVDYRNQTSGGITELFRPGLAANMIRTDAALHEWIGLAVYRATGRTAEFFPAP